MIILIAGPSATGKTILAKRIAERFEFSVIHKDDIKEILFDVLGCTSIEQSKEYEKASWKTFFYFVEALVSKGMNVVLEGNVQAKYCEEEFVQLQKKYDVNIIQIMCTADSDIIIERFKKRAADNRHPGHKDDQVTDEQLKKGIENESHLLNIKSSLIELNMNNFKSLNHEDLFAKIEKLK
ncbi:MAG: ATP-binding protein [Patescibacteria group bacterium]|jgi:predicted kinase